MHSPCGGLWAKELQDEMSYPRCTLSLQWSFTGSPNPRHPESGDQGGLDWGLDMHTE